MALVQVLEPFMIPAAPSIPLSPRIGLRAGAAPTSAEDQPPLQHSTSAPLNLCFYPGHGFCLALLETKSHLAALHTREVQVMGAKSLAGVIFSNQVACTCIS